LNIKIMVILAIEYQDHGYLEYLGSEYDDSVLESLWNEGDKERAKLCTKENGFSSSL